MLNSIMQNKALTLFTVLFMPVLLCLGFWQLDRAEDKRQLMLKAQASDTMLVVESADQLESLPEFQHVQLAGNYLPNYMWYVDNQIWRGKVGVDVIALLQIGQKLVLVNRGWHIWRDRSNLPEISGPSGQVTLEGHLIKPSEKGILLAEDIILSDNYPQLLQKVNMQMLQQYLPLPLLPRVLHLDINSQTALQPHWQPVNITPEKHYGYALQWFGLSLTLCTLFLFRIYKHYKSSPKVAGGE
ncbi:MAG: SURF1 family protein [Gammaproteobacteria bacterium]|nr:SURF1 family protein [Gammaproteobacteria bacterium]MDP6189605.1 SURF1 family protein [Gammaproteobacteria bacterium]